MLDEPNDPIVRIDTEMAELQNDITVALERMQKAEITAEEYKTLVDGYKRKRKFINDRYDRQSKNCRSFHFQIV